MTKNILSLFALALMLSACYQQYDPPVTNPIQYNQAMLDHYDLTRSIPIISLRQGEPETLPFYFTPITAGIKNAKATCTLLSLPTDATATPVTQTIDIPGEWAPMLSAIADTGVYDMSIRVQRGNDDKTYPFRVHIVSPPPPPNCTKCMSRQWQSMNNCVEGNNCTVTIDTVAGAPDSVDIRNISCLGDSVVVRAYLTCGDIIIPRQTTHGYTIYGSKRNVGGICNYLLISIRDTIEHDGTIDYCILHLSR